MSQKKKRATFGEVFERLLSQPLEPGSREGLEAPAFPMAEGLRTEEAIAIGLICKAMRGDTAAAKYIAEMVGEGADSPEPVELTLRVIE